MYFHIFFTHKIPYSCTLAQNSSIGIGFQHRINSKYCGVMSNWRTIPSLSWVCHQLRAGCCSGHPWSATLEPGTGMVTGSRGHWKAGAVLTPHAAVASLQLLAAEAGAASLFICTFMSPFPHTRHCWCATLTQPEPFVLLLFHPWRLKMRARADRDKNWTPGNANVHSHCWKQLCSFRSVRAVTDVFVSVLSCLNKDRYPKGTRNGVYGMAVFYWLSEWHWNSLIS